MRWRLAAVLGLVVTMVAGLAWSQTPDASTEPAQLAADPGEAGVADSGIEEANATDGGGASRVIELEKRLAELEGRSAKAQSPDAGADAGTSEGAATVTAIPGRGFTVTSKDGRFSSTIRPRIQLRDTFTDGPGIAATNEVQVRTLRLTVLGHALRRELRYAFQLAFGGGDFERENPSPIFDAWLEYGGIRDLNVRVGQFFVPFDRARTMREFALEMVDRPGVVRELSLDRDMGVMLFSDDLAGTKVLGYRLFAGGGKGKNRFVANERPGGLGVARLIVRPFGNFDDDIEGDLGRDPKPRLAVGIGVGYNRLTTRQQSTLGMTFTLGQVDYAHGVADAHFKLDGFSLQAEALIRRASDEHVDGIVEGQPRREWSRAGHGYLVQPAMMLTSKLQLTSRWEQLFEWGQTDPQLVKSIETVGNQLGGGVSYYLNGHALKLQADYFVLFGKAPDERHVARLQLDASF